MTTYRDLNPATYYLYYDLGLNPIPADMHFNKKYNDINFIPGDGDSIYELPFDEVTGEQIYVSEFKFREIVNEEQDKRHGSRKNRGDSYYE